MCLVEISPYLFFTECYVKFKVLKESYRTFSFLLEQDDVVCDVTLNKVYLDDYQRETMNHHWPLAKLYVHCREPMWDTLKATFATIILEHYPSEEIFKRHPTLPTLNQICEDYWVEASCMAARRRPQH
ncbi:dual-specificity RNA methyltransferase RlmN [Striga asiatica]|uniref:Dual-specificity RNA methyltransferase RlmN n=1 Tax=Striga asiatica TaxID=4170 RepID=A0A5A7QEI1_STRAF|nr:dual-specificity RNA methyltransferase RlmN [Striga asiatica]